MKEKLKKVLGDAIQYFVTSAGTVSFVVGMVALFVVVPPFITVPLMVGVGLMVAGGQAYKLWKQVDVEQDQARKKAKEEEDAKAANKEMLDVAHDMSIKINDIQTKIDHVPVLPVHLQEGYFVICPSPRGDKHTEHMPLTDMPMFFMEQKHLEAKHIVHHEEKEERKDLGRVKSI